MKNEGVIKERLAQRKEMLAEITKRIEFDAELLFLSFL